MTLTENQIALLFIGGVMLGILISATTWRLFSYLRWLVLLNRAWDMVKKGAMSAADYREMLEDFKKH